MTSPTPKRSVLLVEDDRDIRESLVEILQGQGYLATGAENGCVALDHLKQASRLPALILLDVMMPRMNGIQFRKEQRGTPALSAIPVIIMTATGRDELSAMLSAVQLDGQELDGMQYMRKPLDLVTLLALIARS